MAERSQLNHNVTALLAHPDVAQADRFGYSMGGVVALQVASLPRYQPAILPGTPHLTLAERAGWQNSIDWRVEAGDCRSLYSPVSTLQSPVPSGLNEHKEQPMRSEQEMLTLITTIAEQDERIRAVMLNGSRVNPAAKRDIFQDYDIVYFVTELDAFVTDPTWPHRFGEIMIMQLPEAMVDPPPMNDGHFAYLMQFMDGNRIDLTLFPLALMANFRQESLSRMLLDKDGLFPNLPPATDSDYRPTPPTAKAFADCCNEFWWVAPYVAKGLWRTELPYAKALLDGAMREQLLKMLTWHIGVKTAFQHGPGKFGKSLQRMLEPALWTLVEQSYAGSDYASNWAALLAMCDLFRQTAVPLAQQFGFTYPHGDDQRVSAHLRHVCTLPKTATDMY